jgi:hypothetical protein
VDSAEKPNINFTDPGPIPEVFRAFSESCYKFLDAHSVQVDKAFDLNKQVASFYERIMLLDVGTLALSITALTTLVARFPTAHLPRTTFLWIIVPAWSLLLFSTFGCRAVIAHTVDANKVLYDQWQKNTFQYNFVRIATLITRISNSMSGTITFDAGPQDVNQKFSEMNDSLKQILAELNSTKPIELEFSRRIGPLSVLSMQFGLMLLCYSAVKLLLAI